MKYLKRFNESLSDNFEDYLYSIFEKDADDSLKGDGWFWGRWWSTISDNIEDRLKSSRFDNLVVLTEWFGDGIDILIISPEYYQKNSKWQVANLKWERHPIAIELDKNPELKSFISSSKLISDKAAIVNGLPNRCSLIKGMRFGDGLEFWPQRHLDDPIYVETEVELQALIYKYICDEPISEGLLDFFKKKPNLDEFYSAPDKSWLKINISDIEVHIQPGIKIEKSILDPVILSIKKISNRWNLIGVLNVYYGLNKTIYAKFRLSDLEGDNEWGALDEIPQDVKQEMISDVQRQFGERGIEVDEFPSRGYLIFEIELRTY